MDTLIDWLNYIVNPNQISLESMLLSTESKLHLFKLLILEKSDAMTFSPRALLLSGRTKRHHLLAFQKLVRFCEKPEIDHLP